MKYDRELCEELEELSFKYDRLSALLNCIQILIAEGPIDIKGLPENTLDHSLYEICLELEASNHKLGEAHCKAELIKEGA